MPAVIRKQLALIAFHWHNIGLIFRNYPDTRERLAILRTYLRINWRYHVGVRIAGGHPDRERLLGLDVTLLDYLSFRDVFHELFVLREYEFPGGDAPCILDCGSNIGMSVLFFKKEFPRARIVCFEPGPEAFRCLQHNVSANRLTEVEIHEAAVAFTAGSATLYSATTVEGGDLEMSLMPSQQRAGQLSQHTVRCLRLSEYIDRPIDLIKLDIQGAEGEVIEELEASGKLDRVRRFIIEYHDDRVTERNRLGRLLARLESAGFEFVIHSPQPPPYSPHAGRPALSQIYAYRPGAP